MLRLIIVALFLADTDAAWCPVACQCERSSVNDDLEVRCPESQGVSVLSVILKPNEYIHFQCTSAAKSTDYALLEGLHVSPVPDVHFQQCPLPSTSFLNLIRPFGINDISTLFFQSFGNLSYALTQAHLEGLSNVTRLRLSNNNFTELPSNLLKSLPNLTNLELIDNNLHSLPVGLFDSVPLLTILELGNNNLNTLEPGIFRNLSNLTKLNLWMNQLKNVSGSVFKNLTSLEYLDITSNNFETLPFDLFQDLKNLKILNIFKNNLVSVPEGMLLYTPMLQVFRLYNNKQQLTLPSGFLSRLTNLREVYLTGNSLKTIPFDTFFSSHGLVNLSLSENNLEELSEQLLKDQKNLLLLDLSYNSLEKIPDKLFRNLSSLTTLRLGHNRLRMISKDLLRGLTHLQDLDLEHNQLFFVDISALSDLSSLRQARFSHNNLSFLTDSGYPQSGLQFTDVFGNRSPFHVCTDLEYLYLANNSITEIFYDWKLVMIHLRVLDLSFNKISNLEAEDFHFISPEVSVDLRNNRIARANLYELPTLVQSQDPDLRQGIPRLLLDGNPLICDCLAFGLAQYIAEKMPTEVYSFVHIVPGDMRCAAPSALSGHRLADVMPAELVCHLPQGCPKPCDCMVRPYDTALVVNCSSHELKQVPNALPKPTYTNHTELILEDNHLVELPNKTLPGYDKVTHLFLAGNRLERFDSNILSPNITVLTLDHNNITKMSSSALKILSNSSTLRLVTFHGNPWACDCSTREFLSWLQLKFKRVSFFGNISCADGRSLGKLSAGELCPAPLGLVLGCAVIAAFGIVAGATAAFYYRYNHSIRVWLYARHWCLWLVTEEELDKHKRYDAFVSFSHKQ